MTNPAEEMASQLGQADANNKAHFTTPAELLKDYRTGSITTTFGNTFGFETFIPGNLFIDLGSPVVRQFTDGMVQPDEEAVTSPASDRNVYEHIKNLVCNHVTSVTISQAPQHLCGANVISIDRIPRAEVLEIYRAMRDLSLLEAATFQESGPPSTDGSSSSE